MIKLKVLITQALTVMALIITYMAHSWVEYGAGLNPMFALPLATLLMVLPYIMDHYFEELIDAQQKNKLSTLRYKKPEDRV